MSANLTKIIREVTDKPRSDCSGVRAERRNYEEWLIEESRNSLLEHHEGPIVGRAKGLDLADRLKKDPDCLRYPIIMTGIAIRSEKTFPSSDIVPKNTPVNTGILEGLGVVGVQPCEIGADFSLLSSELRATVHLEPVKNISDLTPEELRGMGDRIALFPFLRVIVENIDL